MEPKSLRKSARRVIRRNSHRLARIVEDFQHDRLDARQERALKDISGDLTALATHFGTDKWGSHRYAQHYQRHLEHLRNRPINLLEIGVGGYANPAKGGESLRMWKQFFPQGEIFGLDLHDKSQLQEPRVHIFRGDQSDPGSLRRAAEQIGRIDVIIDDGSHLSPHVITTFETLFPMLDAHGIYIIEDLQTSYWPEWQGSEDRDAADTSMGLLKRLVDGLNHEEFVEEGYEPTYTDQHVVAAHFYHNVAILQKGFNAEGTRKQKILKDRYAGA